MKKPLAQLFLLLQFLLPYGNAVAQDSSPYIAKHAVGFSAGGAVAAGITYRTYFPRSFIQGSFFARATSREAINNFSIISS